jgi:hypothetical protein
MWLFALAPLVTINALLVIGQVGEIVKGNDSIDWWAYAEASRRFWDGALYAIEPAYLYQYSPVLAPLLAPLGWIGQDAWRLLHVAAVFALPTWPLRIGILLSWPFWFDVNVGNMMVFAVVLAWLALAGWRWAVIGYLAMVILIPKPVFLPVAAWLLWHVRVVRVPFVVAVLVHAGLVVLTGYGDDWIGRIVIANSTEFESVFNIGPSSVLGNLWVPIGLALAGGLTAVGRLGLASVAASPYLLGSYLLMLLLEFRPRDTATQLSSSRTRRLASSIE